MASTRMTPALGSSLQSNTFSEQNRLLEASDIRVIIAQDLGDKAKVVLADTHTSKDSNIVKPDECARSTSCRNAKTRPKSASHARETKSSPELLTELMFGTVPLSYRGTSVRLHPLSDSENSDSRSFLFTKVFTVDAMNFNASGMATPFSESSCTSLSSSFGSNHGLRGEYPFPMTPMRPERATERTAARDKVARERGGQDRACSQKPTSVKSDPESHGQVSTPALTFHHRTPSSGNKSDVGDAAPYVPFTKIDHSQPPEDYFSGWLPSPGPILSRRRRSIDTNGSTSPGSVLRHTRYQAAMCAIGVVFTVPGTGIESNECSIMTRYWQMMTRATHALQCVVYDEIESALNAIIAQATVSSSLSKSQPHKGEPQVYQRGKKLYIALGRNCLQLDDTITNAIVKFKARLAGGISLPEVQQTALDREAGSLIDELAFMIDALDRKETRFIFFTLISYMTNFVKDLQQNRDSKGKAHENILRDRIVIVAEDVVLARRLIFCLARLFFREHNEHLQPTPDYALVWPQSGLLCVLKKDLLQRRQSSLARSRTNSGWDIPRHGKTLSSSYHMHPISPSIYHRPPSTKSEASSRGSSWKPSWSWFGNLSRSALNDDYARSDTKTVQTSWTSADFAEVVKSPRTRSPRSWSPDRELGLSSPLSHGADEICSGDETCEDEGDSIETAMPAAQLNVHVAEDGIVDVDLLRTISLAGNLEHVDLLRSDVSHAEYPLTGILSRFHPDMLLQAVLATGYDETQMKRYLSEEDLYTPHNDKLEEPSWQPVASIAIVELCQSWRIRKLTRLTRSEVSQDLTHQLELKSPELQSQTYEETWNDDVFVDLYEPLRESLIDTIKNYRATGDNSHVQKLIDSLMNFSKP